MLCLLSPDRQGEGRVRPALSLMIA